MVLEKIFGNGWNEIEITKSRANEIIKAIEEFVMMNSEAYKLEDKDEAGKLVPSPETITRFFDNKKEFNHHQKVYDILCSFAKGEKIVFDNFKKRFEHDESNGVGKKKDLLEKEFVEITSKPIVPGEKINLIYWRRSTNEKFGVKVNPYLSAKVIAKHILLSFEPNHEDDFLFRRGRVTIILVKVVDSKETRLDQNLNLTSSGIKEGDTITIEFDISNGKRSGIILDNIDF